jgi:uncharacterized damage-inducible protein DinB
MDRMSKRHYDVEPALGYPIEYGLLVSALTDGTSEWREELGAVSDDVVVWQPVQRGHSIGGVILHMIDVEAFWIETAALGRERSGEELNELLSQETDPYSFNWVVPPRKPLAYYLELQDRIRSRTLESIKQFPDPATVIHREGWNSTMTLRWILNHVVAHEAYHGGQAVMLKEMWLQHQGAK